MQSKITTNDIWSDLEKNLYREYRAISHCYVDADSRRVSYSKWNVIHRKFHSGVIPTLKITRLQPPD